MRNLVVCCDGTWNTPDQEDQGVPTPTNVVRLYNALAEKNIQNKDQLKYYHPGVGTEGNWWERLAGGGVGFGLGKNIMSGYRWLGANYNPGDRIFLFGFSRGAYTVRSLAGMISACGLLDLSGLSDENVWKRVEKAFKKGYRSRADQSGWADGWNFHSAGTQGQDVPIFFLGVWDTVGALGIPNDLAIINLLDDVKKFAFHDTRLNDKILNARHAVAIDEMRASFSPTLWTGVENRPNVKQIWFPGAHSDVGGGYLHIGLSDGALKWMMDEAKVLGLGFHEGMYKQLKPDCRDVLHDSQTGLFKHLRTQPRSTPLLAEEQNSAVHTSALERQSNPPICQAPYRPTKTLNMGETKQLFIYAALPWNYTGIYLEAGVEYEFRAKGQWVDRTIKCGPKGTRDSRFQPAELGHLAGALLGKIEEIFKKLAKNEQADFRGTKREEKLPWFALVGVIANGGNPLADGTPAPHEIIPIKDGCKHTPQKAGYLYCFANDAWNFYGNNRGNVMLEITRP